MTIVTQQQTIASRIDLSGIGVHSGLPVTISLVPAEAGTGIVFDRVDIDDLPSTLIPAVSKHLGPTDLCTIIANEHGASVQTIEHLMAALSALDVDNVIVEIDAAEVPVMDGSSRAFVEAIQSVGLKTLGQARKFIKVLKPVRVSQGSSWAEFTPSQAREFDVEIEFSDEIIGRQRLAIDVTAQSFSSEVAHARTFGFMRDVEKLWAAGFALGSSLDNSVVICDQTGVINPEGTRGDNEFVTHKLLDAIGDLALSGMPILGAYQSYRGGHKLNGMALKELLSSSENYEIVKFDSADIVGLHSASAIAQI